MGINRNWSQYTAARTAAKALNDAGFEAYIIGGAVRDLLLGEVPKDFDLVTNATPPAVLKIPIFKKSYYKDTAQAYGVTRVYVPVKTSRSTHEIELEIATYRRDIEAHLGRRQTKITFSHLDDDVKRRDFTINALALDPAANQLVDLVDGLADIEHEIIRFIGDPDTRIREDPLRILRAARLKNQLGFIYQPATYQALRRAIKEGWLEKIAAERIKIELTRMLTHKNRQNALIDLDELGILKRLLPEVAAQKQVMQPSQLHAEGDVWQHCLLAIQHLPQIINPRLAWATLLHDIGKVETYTPADATGDRIRFSGHHEKGAFLARNVLKRLRFGKGFREEVAWMVHYHLAIDDLPSMRPGRAGQFMSHPAFADLLELHKADAQAAWSITPDGIDKGPADFSHLEAMWNQFQKSKHKHPPSLKHDLGIDGNWVMKNFKIEKGPVLGQLLKELEEAYLDGEITSKQSAKTKVQKLLKDRD